MTDSAHLYSELEEDVRAFAAAVSRHLAGGAGEIDTAESVVTAGRVILLLDPEGVGDEEAAEALLAAPELLASFFQNADLLGTESESARRVARIVTLALERAWEG